MPFPAVFTRRKAGTTSNEKRFIRNRRKMWLSVMVEEHPAAVGFAVVMHGLGGTKDQAHMRSIAQAFYDRGYTVLRFDTTNSVGESGGSYQNATVTNYFEDLEDVIEWARRERWYKEPFVLAGHNMGGMCVGLYAAKYSERVARIVGVAPMVSGPLSLEALRRHHDVGLWQHFGWISWESRSTGRSKRLAWSHMEDRLKYDLFPLASKLTMPYLVVVGSHDQLTPIEHQRRFLDALPGRKELRVVSNAGHRFREPADHARLHQIITSWI